MSILRQCHWPPSHPGHSYFVGRDHYRCPGKIEVTSESIRSRVWATAKKAAVEAWTQSNGNHPELDRYEYNEMLIALRAATEAIFETCDVIPHD